MTDPTRTMGVIGWARSPAGSTVLNSREVAKEFADLKPAMDTRPTSLTGEPGDAVESWLRKFNLIAKALEWADARKLVQAPLYLKLFAANWLDKETKDGTVTPWGNWVDFSAALIMRFRPKDLIQRYKMDMRRRRQRTDEDIGYYFNDKITRCCLVNPKMEDEDVIQQLRDGLLDWFFNHAVLSKAKTPADFYEDLVLAQQQSDLAKQGTSLRQVR